MTTMSSAEGGRIPAFPLGWRMRLALETAGISVAAIAMRMGYSRSTISRWLNDQDVPRTIVLDAWADLTKVNRHWLETGEGMPTDPGGGLPVDADREAQLARAASRHRAHGVARGNHRYDEAA